MMDSQPQYLRQGRHRRLARIPLAVGVGDEADRGVEGAVGADPRKTPLIAGQHPLQSQDRIGEERQREVEEQHVQRVAAPALFRARIDSGEAVKAALDGTKQAVQRGGEPFVERDEDRKSVVKGKSVAGRVELGGGRLNKKKKSKTPI